MIYDLSYPIHEGMTTYPADRHPRVEVTQVGRHQVEGAETRRVVLGTHTGTHIDAPRHFLPADYGVDGVPLDALVGPATVSRDGVPDVVPERLILDWGWWTLDSGRFYDAWPTLDADDVARLVDGGCRLLGMDTPSPDPRDGSAAHRQLLAAGVVLVEYMTNLRDLPGVVDLIVAPLNIVGGDGAPARCFARVP